MAPTIYKKFTWFTLERIEKFMFKFNIYIHSYLVKT